MNYTLIFIIYLIAINVASFIAMGADKHRARCHCWRIPERVFMLLALFGACVGIIFAMGVFHHKTKHAKFCIGVPVIFLLQLSAAAVLTML